MPCQHLVVCPTPDCLQDAPHNATPGVKWVKANYDNVVQLADVLEGVDTVLSFIVAHSDPGSVAQKNLIDAAVRAGVRRFAPSEWTGWVCYRRMV